MMRRRLAALALMVGSATGATAQGTHPLQDQIPTFFGPFACEASAEALEDAAGYACHVGARDGETCDMDAFFHYLRDRAVVCSAEDTAEMQELIGQDNIYAYCDLYGVSFNEIASTVEVHCWPDGDTRGCAQALFELSDGVVTCGAHTLNR